MVEMSWEYQCVVNLTHMQGDCKMYKSLCVERNYNLADIFKQRMECSHFGTLITSSNYLDILLVLKNSYISSSNTLLPNLKYYWSKKTGTWFISFID